MDETKAWLKTGLMLETDNVNNSNDDMVNRVSLGSTLMSPR